MGQTWDIAACSIAPAMSNVSRVTLCIHLVYIYYDSRAFRVFVAYCLDCQSPIVEIRVRFPGGHCEAFVKDQ